MNGEAVFMFRLFLIYIFRPRRSSVRRLKTFFRRNWAFFRIVSQKNTLLERFFRNFLPQTLIFTKYILTQGFQKGNTLFSFFRYLYTVSLLCCFLAGKHRGIPCLLHRILTFFRIDFFISIVYDRIANYGAPRKREAT